MADTYDSYHDLDAWRVLIERGLIITCICSGLQDSPELHDPETSMLSLVLLNGRLYGISSQCVRAMQRLESYRPLPLTHPYVVGIVSVAGQSIIVVDMRLLVNAARQLPRPGMPLLLVELNTMQIGLLVDAVVSSPMGSLMQRAG